MPLALKGDFAGTVCSYAPALKDGIGIWTKVVFRNGSYLGLFQTL